MNVILLEKVGNLGDIGDLVSVKAGYGRNYLLPEGKAALATKEKIAEVEVRRVELEKAAAQELSVARDRADLFNEMELIVQAKAGEEGKLFGSVGPIDICESFSKINLEVERSEIRMPDGPLRELGDFEVSLHLHADIDVLIKVKVVAEE